MTTEADHLIIRSSTPVRVFDNLGEVTALKVFPDGRRMAVSSSDGILRVWDLKKGVLLKELEIRGEGIQNLAISRDGKLIVGSDEGDYLTAWDGDTGRRLTQAMRLVDSFDISPDGATLAISGSSMGVTLRSTVTWQLQGEAIKCCRGSEIGRSVRYSPSGQFLAIATTRNIQIWDPARRIQVATLDQEYITSLVWTPDGTCLLAVCSDTIQQWDSSTWKPVGSSIWTGAACSSCQCVAVNCNSTVIAFPTTHNRVRLWHLSDCRTIALFQHSESSHCIDFSVDGKHIFAGGEGQKISVWAVPETAWPKDIPNDQVTYQTGGWYTGEDPDSMTQELAAVLEYRDRDAPPVRGRSRSRSPGARSNSSFGSLVRRRSSPHSKRPSQSTIEAPSNPLQILGVFGLSTGTQERDLDEEFSRYGRVERVTIVYDLSSDRSRGFGFIRMSSADEAARCITELNGTELNGQRIRVEYPVADRPHAPTPGKSYIGHRRSTRDTYLDRDPYHRDSYDDDNYTISDIDSDIDIDMFAESHSTLENISGVPCQVPEMTDKGAGDVAAVCIAKD